MKIFLGTLVFWAAMTAACADPAANKPKATTAPPSTTTSATTSSAPTAPADKGTAVSFSEADSKLEFTGSKVTGKHDGGFKKFSGTINLVGEKADMSSVTVDIDMTSLFSDSDGLTKHLMTADFFEVEKFPKATFVSTKIERPAGTNGPFNITGDLEMHGVKKSVGFPATIRVTPDVVSVVAEFSINRKDFGIVYAGKVDDLIRDDVVIKLELTPKRVK